MINNVVSNCQESLHFLYYHFDIKKIMSNVSIYQALAICAFLTSRVAEATAEPKAPNFQYFER